MLLLCVANPHAPPTHTLRAVPQASPHGAAPPGHAAAGLPAPRAGRAGPALPGAARLRSHGAGAGPGEGLGLRTTALSNAHGKRSAPWPAQAVCVAAVASASHQPSVARGTLANAGGLSALTRDYRELQCGVADGRRAVRAVAPLAARAAQPGAPPCPAWLRKWAALALAFVERERRALPALLAALPPCALTGCAYTPASAQETAQVRASGTPGLAAAL